MRRMVSTVGVLMRMGTKYLELKVGMQLDVREEVISNSFFLLKFSVTAKCNF